VDSRGPISEAGNEQPQLDDEELALPQKRGGYWLRRQGTRRSVFHRKKENRVRAETPCCLDLCTETLEGARSVEGLVPSLWHYWEVVEPSERNSGQEGRPLKGKLGPWSLSVSLFCFLAGMR
jgi:hypothetical protein